MRDVLQGAVLSCSWHPQGVLLGNSVWDMCHIEHEISICAFSPSGKGGCGVFVTLDEEQGLHVYSVCILSPCLTLKPTNPLPLPFH